MRDPRDQPLPGRPLKPVETATGQIHLRVPMARKNLYVHAARRSGRPLAAWMIEVCDRAVLDA